MSPYGERLPEGSVRLLQLLPHQDHNSRIECRLITCSILGSGRTHPYEALSYVWGSSEDKRSIYIDGVEQPVPKHLHHALSRLRDCFVERVLWIDAICINQNDEEEKGQQLQLMAKIYAKASRVIVWLVDPPKDAPDKTDPAADDQVDNGDQALEAIRAAAKERRVDSTMDQRIIRTLLERKWFQRIWAFQEVAAARHILIKSGSTEIEGDAFCKGLSVLRGEESKFERAQSNIGSHEDGSGGKEDSNSGRDLGAGKEAPDLPMYKRIMAEFIAYRWRVAQLHREFTLTPPTHAISAAIQKRLYSRAENRRISRGRGPPTCTMVFQSQWDPLAVVAYQEYGDAVSPSEAIERAIVLNEGPDGEGVVEALTCGEYLRRTWPMLGEHFVELIQHVVAVEPGIKCIAHYYDGTKLTAWLQPEHTRFMLEAVGTSETVVEVGEMFAWLTAAFRTGVGEEVSHVIPVVEPATAAGQDDEACKIAIRCYDVLPPGGYASRGQCWRDLFRNPPELGPREGGYEQGEPPSLSPLDVPTSGSGSGSSSPGTMPRIIRSVRTSLQSLLHPKGSSNSSLPNEADGDLSQQNSAGRDSILRRARKKVGRTVGTK
ncbi:hypothetical protein MAPG_10756 [Magnaporthiopsis poae ATCC 64411]|uniref:Heterokaryon incompatibility domain-containing protein n=1 Tax=Magnaporthiopsis poae (strain ATCC 64411 / 73-15) TaxID=644358 RepID=A0A0C4EDF8_MAGP6|nr:hypothetical protein MAPG_10756 [Magnaporthiopsis poae ATCC 64411]